jgi:cation transport regulator ChaB
MIEWFMFGALGFFLGCLLALMLAPPLWNRAVKLTTRKLEATMPMTLADIQADKDQLRAEFAIELRKVEVALEKSKEKAARELIEANKRRVEIQMLNTDLGGVKSQLQESQNANRVLQQTIKRRLPDLDARLKAAKKALAELETVNAELRNTVASQSEALKIARNTVHNQRADIDRLRMSLESGAASMRGSSKSDGRAVAESQRLAADLSRMHEELERAKTSAEENAFLRRELSRLASQILTAARNNAMHQHVTAAPQQHDDYAEAEMTEEVAAQEAWHEAHAGNGTVPEHEMERAGMEMEAAGAEPSETTYAEAHEEQYAEAHYEEHPERTREEEYVEEEDEYVEEERGEEEPEQKTSLAQRFAARRAKRNADKGGGSLTSRLRGLVADSQETRG